MRPPPHTQESYQPPSPHHWLPLQIGNHSEPSPVGLLWDHLGDQCETTLQPLPNHFKTRKGPLLCMHSRAAASLIKGSQTISQVKPIGRFNYAAAYSKIWHKFVTNVSSQSCCCINILWPRIVAPPKLRGVVHERRQQSFFFKCLFFWVLTVPNELPSKEKMLWKGNGESLQLGSKEKVASSKSSLPHSMKTMKLKAFTVFQAYMLQFVRIKNPPFQYRGEYLSKKNSEIVL